MRRIEGVAIRYEGIVFSLGQPYRHHHVIHDICSFMGIKSIGENEQGFVDEVGVFMDRKEALAVATVAGQLKPDEPIRAGVLFSENLW